MLPDVRALAEDAAEIRHSQGYESYRATDRDRACDKEHYGQQEQGLMDVLELDLAVEMTRQGLCGPYRSCRSHSKKGKGEDDVSCSHAFKVEVGCSP